MSPLKPCRIAVIGTGRIGRLHAENITRQLPQFQLVGLADPALDWDWAKSLCVPLCSQDPNELIHADGIDALILASPSDQHVSQLLLAAAAGKAVFCEKPLGLEEAAIQTVLSAFDDRNLLLQVGFNRRFDPHFAALQQRVQAGEMGQPQVLKITSRDPACPPLAYVAQSGGLFMDMTIHDFDMARFILGSEVQEVYASGAVLINPDFESCQDIDTAIVQLRFSSGALAVIDNSRQAAYGYDQRLELLAAKGMLWVDNLKENQLQALAASGHWQAKPEYFFLQRYQQAYINELTAFYQAWATGQPSPVPGLAGLQALRIAKAANRSLATNQPVRLDGLL